MLECRTDARLHFVQKYQLYLPEREELRSELELTLREAGTESGEAL
jgi:hypothetical protein